MPQVARGLVPDGVRVLLVEVESKLMETKYRGARAGGERWHAHHMLTVSDLRADTHGDLMSVIEAVAAETAATNAAVAAAATAAAAEAAAASKAAAAHDRRQNRYRGERAARPRRAHALEKPDLLKEPGGGAGLMNGEDFSGGQCLECGPGCASSRRRRLGCCRASPQAAARPK